MTGKVAFLDILRASSCLLIVYSHLIADQDPNWFVVPAINRFVTDPLGILSNVGFLAVAVFFLVSGFIITHVAQRETRVDFVIKRVFRIFPPFLVTVAVLAVLGRAFNISEIVAMSPADLLREASLFDSSFKLVGPSWTLVIEIMFYALATMLLPLFKTRPAIITAFIGVLPVLVRLLLGDAVAASGVAQFTVLLDFQNYLSVFGIGMAIYYAWAGRLRVRTAVAVGMVAWCSLVWTMDQTVDGKGVPLNILYGAIVFVLVLWANPNPRAGSPIVKISQASYSLYLFHVGIGWLVLHGLRPVLGFSAALAAALVLIGAITFVSYITVERPSQAAARWLIQRLSPRTERMRAALRTP